mgnify:CR=1 FL=1
MKSYLSLIPISAKVHRRQNRMTLLCIIFSVFMVTAIFSMAEMGARITCIRRATREMGQVAAEFMLERLGNNTYASNRRIHLIPELRLGTGGRDR